MQSNTGRHYAHVSRQVRLRRLRAVRRSCEALAQALPCHSSVISAEGVRVALDMQRLVAAVLVECQAAAAYVSGMSAANRQVL